MVTIAVDGARHTVGMRLVDWMFRDRVHGGITIAQFPNWSLGLWMACLAVRFVAEPKGTVGTVVEITGTAALMVWAVDEMARGVNPWRRILGTVVFVATIVGLTKRVVS